MTNVLNESASEDRNPALTAVSPLDPLQGVVRKEVTIDEDGNGHTAEGTGLRLMACGKLPKHTVAN